MTAEKPLSVGAQKVKPAAQVPPAALMDTESLNAQIANLKKVQNEMRMMKKKATLELRNLERKRQRLSKKARLLSDKDLLQVLQLRSEKSGKNRTAVEEAASEPGATAAGSSANAPL